MGFNSGFKMGLQLLEQNSREAQQAKENAWREEQQQSWRDQQARDTQQRSALEQLRGQALQQSDTLMGEKMYAPGMTFPSAPPGATSEFGAVEAAGPPVPHGKELAMPQGYMQQAAMNRAMLQAAPNLESIASLQDRQQKLKYFSEGRALGDYVRGAKDIELDAFTQDITNSARNGYKVTKGKNGYFTIEADSSKPIRMDREQLADWLSSQHVYKNTGDESALKRIGAISADLARRVKEAGDDAKDQATVGNTGVHYSRQDADSAARLAAHNADRKAIRERQSAEDWTPIGATQDGKGMLVYNRRTRQTEVSPLPPGEDADGFFRKLTGAGGGAQPQKLPEDGTRFLHPTQGVVTYWNGRPVAEGGVSADNVPAALKKAGYNTPLLDKAESEGRVKAHPFGLGVMDQDGVLYRYNDPEDARALNAKLLELASRTIEGEEGRKRHGEDGGVLERRFPQPPRDTRMGAPGVTPFGRMPPPGYAIDPSRFQGR